jgi:hypothetical protein
MSNSANCNSQGHPLQNIDDEAENAPVLGYIYESGDEIDDEDPRTPEIAREVRSNQRSATSSNSGENTAAMSSTHSSSSLCGGGAGAAPAESSFMTPECTGNSSAVHGSLGGKTLVMGETPISGKGTATWVNQKGGISSNANNSKRYVQRKLEYGTTPMLHLPFSPRYKSSNFRIFSADELSRARTSRLDHEEDSPRTHRHEEPLLDTAESNLSGEIEINNSQLDNDKYSDVSSCA